MLFVCFSYHQSIQSPVCDPSSVILNYQYGSVFQNKVNGEQLDPALLKPANDQQTDEEDSDYYFSD